jgi:hypothetical protein
LKAPGFNPCTYLVISWFHYFLLLQICRLVPLQHVDVFSIASSTRLPTPDSTMSVAVRWGWGHGGECAATTAAAEVSAGAGSGVVTATTFVGGGAFAPACIAAGHHGGDVSIELLPTVGLCTLESS